VVCMCGVYVWCVCVVLCCVCGVVYVVLWMWRVYRYACCVCVMCVSHVCFVCMCSMNVGCDVVYGCMYVCRVISVSRDMCCIV
jgi:hypothetical protein